MTLALDEYPAKQILIGLRKNGRHNMQVNSAVPINAQYVHINNARPACGNLIEVLLISNKSMDNIANVGICPKRLNYC